MSRLKLVHFSDVLCIWAFIGQEPLSRLSERFGDQIEIDVHYCSVFPDTTSKISKLWKNKGGFEGYASHVQDIARGFDSIKVHEKVWAETRPLSSASPHLFLKAVELVGQDDGATDYPSQVPVRAARALRSAFFHDAKNISDWSVQSEVSDQIGLKFSDVSKKIETGEAMAMLSRDYELAQSTGVKGSPTYVLNNGRQVLLATSAIPFLRQYCSRSGIYCSKQNCKTGAI